MKLQTNYRKPALLIILIVLMLSLASAAPNPSSGTLEAYVKLSDVLDNHTIFSAPQEGAETSGGLVGYWRFNNDSAVGEDYNGTNASLVYDYSGEGNTGVWYTNRSIVGGGWNSSGGKFGGAFVFDGWDDYVNVSNVIDTTKSFTAEMWINAKDVINSQAIWADNAGVDGKRFFIRLGFTDGMVDSFFEPDGGTNYVINYTITTDTWYHITATADNSANTMRLYANGQEIDSLSITFPTSDAGAAELIGSSTVVGPFPFNGTIDSVRIYNRSLSAEEIKASYLGLSLFKHLDNLVFHSGNATLIYDVSSWGNSQWHHLTGTWENSSSTARLYVDGTQTNSTTFREGGSFGSYGYIGSDWRGSPGYTTDGIIDQVRILNVSLDADSISKSYNYTASSGEFARHLTLNYFNPAGNLTSSIIDLSSDPNSRQNLNLSWNEFLPYGEEFSDAASHGLVSYWSFDENRGNVTYDQSLRGGNDEQSDK